MLIATAGHIDHGKSALVRALTGVETDRLPEEQVRGISIDLGFAYWRPDDGEMIGFIDVPGHERLVRNMIAGLSGVDLALIVVAADDGAMPQTIEHVQILSLLGIGRGMVVITKTDRVTAERLAKVRGEVGALLAATPFASSPVFEVNSLDHAGIPALAAAIAAERRARSGDDAHGFRLTIDRCFSVAGAGTVVTGAIVAGRAALGDSVVLLPQGRELRIRGIQSAGAKVDTVGKGARVALNLTGVERAEVHRGDWLASPALARTSQRIEALFTLAGDRDKPLRHDSQVQFHHGAASIGARVLAPRQRALQPGVETVVRIVLDAPTSAVTGERFVLRDQSGRVLLGGGQVLNPHADPRRRSQADRNARAQAMALADPAQCLAALAAAPGIEAGLDWFAAAANLLPEAVERLLADGAIVPAGKSGGIAVTAARIAHLEQALVGQIGAHHQAHPQQGGLPRRAARTALPEIVSADLFDGIMRNLVAAGRIEADGALLRLPGFAASFSQGETDFWRKVRAALEGRPPRPIVVQELARELGGSVAAVSAMLLRRKASGDLWQVTETKYLLRDHVAGLVALAAELDRESESGFTAGGFRNASGLGRNFVIQLLEFFDRIGVTRRNGEARRMRGDWEAVVGPANPVRRA